jgi:hypothetical protein
LYQINPSGRPIVPRSERLIAKSVPPQAPSDDNADGTEGHRQCRSLHHKL